MPISDEKKIIFIHIPKNAGTSLEKQFSMRATGHKPWFVYEQKYPLEWKKYIKFAIVRNPFDRLVSNYEYAKMPKSFWHSNDGNSVYGKHPDYDICNTCSFEQIIDILLNNPYELKHDGWKPQYIWICNENNDIMVDKVLKYENLNEELKQHNISDNLKILNTSNRKQYNTYYNNKLYEKIFHYYNIDFKLFYKDIL